MSEITAVEPWTGYDTMLPVYICNDEDYLFGNIESALLDSTKECRTGSDRTRNPEETNRIMETVFLGFGVDLAVSDADADDLSA